MAVTPTSLGTSKAAGSTGEVADTNTRNLAINQLTNATTGAVIKGDLVYNVKDYGAVGNGVTDDTASVSAAIAAAAAAKRELFVPAGEYVIAAASSLSIAGDGVVMRGAGTGQTIFKRTAAPSAPAITISGSNVTVKDLTIQGITTGSYRSCLKVTAGSHIRIDNCEFTGGQIGVWLDPPSSTAIRHVTISRCEFSSLNGCIYLGSDTVGVTGESITDVFVEDNHMHDGVIIGSGLDGVKMVRKVKNLVISRNLIEDMPRDAIDLFASGDTVLVSDNILRNNVVKAVDIKSDIANYPAATYGNNGERITFTGNICTGNDTGISIAQNLVAGDANHYVLVQGNTVADNDRYGILASGRSITIDANMVIGNATLSDNAIEIGRDDPDVTTQNILVTNNQVFNNGSVANAAAYGISVRAYVSDCIVKNNVVKNDASLPNNYQYGGLYVNAFTTNIRVQDNICRGHTFDVTAVNGHDIRAERLYIAGPSLPNDYAATEVILLSSLDYKVITKASLVLALAVTANATNYVSLAYGRVSAAGATRNTISSIVTSSTGITALTETALSNPSSTIRYVAPTDLVTARFTKGGTGAAVTNPTFILDYVTY